MKNLLKQIGFIALAVIVFSMAACDDGSTNPTTYAVTVTNGTGSGNYSQGVTVTITANTPPAGQQFANWTTTSAGVTFANADSASTTFTMPGNTVTVTAPGLLKQARIYGIQWLLLGLHCADLVDPESLTDCFL